MILSNKEENFIQHTDFFSLKISITNKIMQAFSEIETEMKSIYPILSQKVSFAPIKTSSKISKGENLKNLPFLMLDFPKQFEQTNIFSFRLLFWWGKGFTLFLHLKNDNLKGILKQISTNQHLCRNNYRFAIDGDEWEHDLDTENYHKLDELKNLKKIPYIKIAIPLKFEKINDLEIRVIEAYRDIFKLIQNHE